VPWPLQPPRTVRAHLPSALLILAGAAVLALALAHGGEIRDRAEAALAMGMPPREAALARGFVLGDDGGIDDRTVEDFRRSGLAHLLAASGQNVALLALLAMPVLAAFGLSLRARLVWILGLIAVYVPLAGAGPSIQRAGVMGALGVLATLAGRRAARFHALAVAAIVTLAVDPALAVDVGWQLSFAALLGILGFAGPLRNVLVARLGIGSWRSTLVDGIAMTSAATLATAPLVAFHFGTISTTTLLANLLALPAVAPAMWLGMLAAMAGQAPGVPVEALNWLAAPLLAYVAQIASWCGRPSWAYLEVGLGVGGLLASYLAIVVVALLVGWWRRRRRVAAARRRSVARRRRYGVSRRRSVLAAAVVLAAIPVAWPGAQGAAETGGGSPRFGLRISVLDVGQGDAILLQPAGRDPILVDAGPPGAGIAELLTAAGVERLAALIVTHDQSDHAGGIAELLESMPIESLLFAALDRETLAIASAAGVEPRRLSAGSEVSAGPLTLRALWPPAGLLRMATEDEDPNRLSLVLLLRWHDFSMLLSGDAEAESTPLDPGPLDVLKVAHHGSDDIGLDELLDRSRPRLAIVSVGEGNPFGHPTPATLAALAEADVPTLRTDLDGTVVLEARRGSFSVDAAD